jgi:hypothetical protein
LRRLNDRTRWFYIALFAGLILGLGGTAAGVILLDESGRANDRAGRILATVFVGMSYAWWMSKHTRHHANPNRMGTDPDLEAWLSPSSASSWRCSASTRVRRSPRTTSACRSCRDRENWTS